MIIEVRVHCQIGRNGIFQPYKRVKKKIEIYQDTKTLKRVQEVSSFSGTLLQSGAAAHGRKSANIISEYVRSFCRKGPGNRLFSKIGFSGEFGQKNGIYYT
jgi:hypothetical protein